MIHKSYPFKFICTIRNSCTDFLHVNQRRIYRGPCPSEQMLCPPEKICAPEEICKICATIAGKVLKIRPKIKNPQNFSPAAGRSVYSYLIKLVPPRKIEKFVLHCWKSAQNNRTEDQKCSSALCSSVYSCLGNFVPLGKFVIQCWKSAPNTTEDQKFSKNFACGGQFSVILSSESQFLPC